MPEAFTRHAGPEDKPCAGHPRPATEPVRRCVAAAAAAMLIASNVAAIALLSGCITPHPFMLRGDAKSVEVEYYGDVASALPLARQHCAEYQLAPRFAFAGAGVANFDCVPP
jgi:hypothetical protein